ncbi:MAG: GNAT family N-acetyltransferase [Acidobacteriota bacterium]
MSNSEVKLRPATMSDLAGIKGVIISNGREGNGQHDAWWEQRMEAESVIVAEADGQIVGVGAIDLHVSQITHIYVSQERHRAGIGSTLLKALEDMAQRAGRSAIRLDSTAEAFDFYRKNGYRIRGAVPMIKP